jgi:hypothetical protein
MLDVGCLMAGERTGMEATLEKTARTVRGCRRS